MKKSLIFLAAAALAVVAFAAQAMGVDPLHALGTLQQSVHAVIAAHPNVALGLAGLGAAGITTFVQPGDVLDLDPGASVPSGTGHLFGAALFGVAAVDAVSGTASSFVVEGVVDIAKTNPLVISVGDRLFWDATNKCVNKTTTAQQQVGICVKDAGSTDATVRMLLESALPVAT